MYYTEFDYTQMALDLGFNIPKKSKGMVSCFKHKDNHPSMSIDLNQGVFNCFSCGYKVFGKYYGTDSQSDSRNIIENRQLDDYFFRALKPSIVQNKKYFSYEVVATYDCKILRDWLDYRGISESVAKAAELFYGEVNITYQNEEDGKYKTYAIRDRVFFPIKDKNRKVVSLEMRFPFFGKEPESFKDGVRKVLYPKHSSTNLLYERYKLDRNKKLYVLEGLMDCLAFRSLTKIQNSTALFGANITSNQKEDLNSFSQVCYVFNKDEAGKKSVESLRESFKGKFTTLAPVYNDVGDMAIRKFAKVDEWLKTEQK